MARQKMTEEQKAQRKLDKKAEKQALRDAEWAAKKAVWAQQAADSRAKILETLEPSFKARLDKALEYSAKSNNDFFKDIANKWWQYGNLSAKQMQVLIDSTERDAKKYAIAEVIEEWYVVGEKSQITKLNVKNVQDVVTSDGFGNNGITTKITLQNRAGIFFTLKTNAGKWIKFFSDALEAQQQVNLNATIKWHFKDSDTVILTSRGLKAEIVNV